MAQTTSATTTPPIIIDLGKIGKKKVRQFKEGRGEIAAEVQQILNETRANLGADAAGKELVPIVLVYKQKKRGGRGGKKLGLPFPF
ncbi:MAG TPA: hypothetical protein VN811_05715 [Thermoanaerobaculia bacterium]|nr:hypothetical protein [Thermoanaerobaculia bacterium]HXT50517.1 hypothetical protein [Thermoanaerobaculia bacterium]